MEKTITRLAVLFFCALTITACDNTFANLGRLVIGIGGLICAYLVYQLIGGEKKETIWSIVAGLATLIGFIVVAAILPEAAATVVAVIAILIGVVAAIAYFRNSK